jgi:copper chaperone CopZ
VRDELTLLIDGMHCESCVRRVKIALHGVKGVEPGTVEVGLAQVTFDPNQVNAEGISAAIDCIGFSARVQR